MPEVVVFKLEVFDETLKQKAIKVVSEFPGVTSVDVKETGRLKVKGNFDKFVMMKKLKKVYKYVGIIEVEQVPTQNHRSPVKKPEHKVMNKPIHPKKVTRPTTTHPRRKTYQAENSDCIIL